MQPHDGRNQLTRTHHLRRLDHTYSRTDTGNRGFQTTERQKTTPEIPRDSQLYRRTPAAYCNTTGSSDGTHWKHPLEMDRHTATGIQACVKRMQTLSTNHTTGLPKNQGPRKKLQRLPCYGRQQGRDRSFPVSWI